MLSLESKVESWIENHNIAIIEEEKDFSYNDLYNLIKERITELQKLGFEGKSVVLEGDFTVNSVVDFLSLLLNRNIVLLSCVGPGNPEQQIKLSGADYRINSITSKIDELNNEVKPDLIMELIECNKSGFIILSSGTTGSPKAILHSTDRFIQKYQYSKKAFKTLGFLLFDHIAGVDTLFYTLFASGSLVALKKRDPDTVIKTIRSKNVQVFPTTPSYINLLLFEESFIPSNLTSLEIITLGSERISEFTLERLKSRFNDNIKILQKYGLSEVGSPIVQSKKDDPLWIKFDNRNNEYKVIDNVLYIKANTTMVGYIYEDRCEKPQEWINTEDKVEINGEWLKILGRETDIINVGGQKVYPTEVESVLMELNNIKNISIYSLKNNLMGQVVAAKITLHEEEDMKNLKYRIRSYCKSKLENYKIPVHIEITKDSQISDRFKKKR